ncbi:ABC transporter permease [Rarobacter faecitabidus]|uniref:Nucleoside ABC transporter membrane protein n=1 Tax=Rarobacter faecitabidus TaxID=13243 RepID=A0A542ZVK1_RARFA|nr:ABC transporter permease [Rarobacter faecitabidus]TQL64200.1 nucleoside ABC transporter membrane protein [Rarobacter faecitabidus]
MTIEAVTLSESLEKAPIRSLKTPIAFAIFTALSVMLFVGFARDERVVFQLSPENAAIKIPLITVTPVIVGSLVSILLAGATIYAALLAREARKTPVWVTSLVAFLFTLSFLAWAGAGNTLNITQLLVSSVALSTPLIFGSLGGILSERAGVVNVAIEGQLLAGAFLAAVVSSVTGSPWAGLFAAGVGGMLVGFVLATFSIKYWVEQVIVGVVINVLVSGLTSFLYTAVLVKNTETLNTATRFGRWKIPVLADIPVIGPVLFNQTVIVYVMYLAVFGVWFGLFHTRWGLRLRAVGEHPQAADTVGINVNRTRFWNVALAGVVAGAGGAYFTLDSVSHFGKDMTAGLGFIALAAVIFGRWNPIRATLASLLFGFAMSLQFVLGAISSGVPSEFLLMLPYVVTVFAVAGFVGHVSGPAASGKPYVKG